jgi:hypothetical protein
MRPIGNEPITPVPNDGTIFRGMTYRQWLAGMSLTNLAGTNNPQDVGRACVAFADAVIAELEKSE